MHVHILEPDHRGHRLAHVRRLAEAVLPLASRVTVSLPRESQHWEEFGQLASLVDRVQVELTLDGEAPEGYLQRAAYQWREIAREVARIGPDHVWMPTADFVAQMTGIHALRGSKTWPEGVEAEGVLHRFSPAYRADRLRDRLRRRTVAQLLRRAPWERLHVVDRLAYEWMAGAGGFSTERIGFLPDPVEHVERVGLGEARRRLGLPEGGRYIGCSGALDAHKGLHLLLPAFEGARLRADDRLLLAGQATPDVEVVLKAFQRRLGADRLIRIGRYLDDAELMNSLAAMDLVCTPYRGHIGISNVLLRAQAAGRPVLGCTGGWQEMMVTKLQVGWSCPVEDTEAFARALERGLDESAAWTPPAAVARLLEFHSLENYASHVTCRIRERMGALDVPSERSWFWVLHGEEGEVPERARPSCRPTRLEQSGWQDGT